MQHDLCKGLALIQGAILATFVVAVTPAVHAQTPKEAATTPTVMTQAMDKSSLTQAVLALSGKDIEARDKALDTLVGSTYRGHDLVNPLIKLLSDPSSRVRAQSVKILGEVGDPKAIDPLKPLAKDSTARVRKEVARAFRLLKARDAIPELLVLAEDRAEEVSNEAIVSLQFFKDPRAVKPLTEIMINGQTYRLRSSAIRALGDIGSREPVSQMIVLLEYERDIWLRLDIARALAKIGDPEAQTPLLRTLEAVRRESNEQSDPRRKSVYNEISAELEKAIAELKANIANPKTPTKSASSTSAAPTAAVSATPETSTILYNDDETEDEDAEDGYAAPASNPTAPAAPTQKAQPEKPAQRGGGKFSVQVKATTDAELAKSLTADLEAKGEKAFVTTFKKGKTTWYRVRVGSFPSRTEAQAYAEALKQRAVIADYFITN